MILTQQDIEHLAKLARLKLDSETEKKFAEQLSRVIEYVEVIDQQNIPEQEADLSNAKEPIELREDKSRQFSSDDLGKLPPKKEGKFIVSPPLN